MLIQRSPMHWPVHTQWEMLTLGAPKHGLVEIWDTWTVSHVTAIYLEGANNSWIIQVMLPGEGERPSQILICVDAPSWTLSVMGSGPCFCQAQ